MEILRAGGNAVDAACATALALGVVDPFASGLGGGGFALAYRAKGTTKQAGQLVALDFRETAPAGLAPAELGQRLLIPKQSGLSVGVPGEPRGLAELVRRFGALPFSRCIEPALRLARGFAVSPWLAQQIGEEYARDPATGPDLIGSLFGIDRAAALALKPGTRVSRPALARTLARLRREGVDAFYRGEIAGALVRATRAAGGVLSRDDLAGYAPVERAPLVSGFLGRTVVGMPPPSAGGVIVSEALGVLAEHVAAMQRAGAGSALTLHLVAEALKHGFADRARFLGDPDFTDLPLAHLLDPAYHKQLASRLAMDHVLAHEAYGTPAAPVSTPARDAGTANLSVIDSAGNAVVLTTTINLAFGARIVAGDTGILLNDELDDFTAAPDRRESSYERPHEVAADVFTISGNPANFAAPRKRPLSSMSPTLVLGPAGVEMVVGAAGGPRIPSATLQILLDVLLFGRDVGAAVAAPRIHHQWEPDLLYVEPGVPAEVVEALESKGHATQSAHDLGKANAVYNAGFHPSDHDGAGLQAASDPRSGGAPAGY